MTLALNNAPIPLSDPIARTRRAQYGNKPDPLEGMVTTPWIDYLSRLVTVISQNPNRVNSVELTAQGASIGATDMSGGALNAGLYRVSYQARITRAGTVSSSLTVALAWTDGGVAVTFSYAAVTGNTTGTTDSNTRLIRIDGASPITYSTTYASVGATTMQHSLDLTLEIVKA